MTYIPPLTAELKRHGATGIEIDRAHPHPRISFIWNGARMFFVTGSSPSDCKGLDNALSDLRRLMGVRKIVRKSLSRRTRKRCIERVVGQYQERDSMVEYSPLTD